MKKTLNQRVVRLLTAGLFGVVGVLHFIDASFFISIVPPWLTHPLALVYISGGAEILGGIGLLVPGCRRWAGGGLILLLIAVFPANIHMFNQAWQSQGLAGSTLWLALRLPVQFVFIAIVNWVSRPSQGAW